MPLADLVRAEIRKSGPISFSEFMKAALYHPEHGYYSSGRARIGREGDYYTSVSVGPLFGRLLMAQFVETWERLGKPAGFMIVEQGAHDGQFARDVLESAQQSAPEFFKALKYRIVEPFPILEDRQRKMVQPSFPDHVEWRNALEPFTGIHFSNELIDALPIDLPGKRVGLDGERFALVDWPAEPGRRLNQTALDWLDDISVNLQRGYLISIDYGSVTDEFEPAVQTRAQHRYLESPFDQIGQADITARVDWKSIATHAQQAGFSVAGFADQHHFLAGLLAEDQMDAKSKRQLQTLLHPEMLGRSFQVLALAKNTGDARPLAGFRLTRDPAGLLA